MPQYQGFKSYFYLIPYVKSHRLRLLGVFISLLFTSFSVLALGKGIAYLIDQGFNSHNPNLLNHAMSILLSVIIMLAIATYCRAYLINSVCEHIIASIRRDVYRHVIHLSPSFFETHKTSDVLSRLTTDTALVSSIISSVLSTTLRSLILFIGGITMIIHTSPKLTAYVLFIVPAILIPLFILGKRVRRLSRIAQEKTALIGAHIEESLAGIKTVQAYTREIQECHQFNDHVTTAFQAELNRLRIRSLLVALVILCAFTAIACVLWIGGHDVLSGKMSGGDLSSFIFYAIVVASSTSALSEVFGDIQRAAGAIERIFELKMVKPLIVSPILPETLLLPIKGSVTFNHIHFAYPSNPNQAVLTDFSLTLNPGETVALVGPSGAGKSTILQLLLRFYVPDSGCITLDGIDISYLSLHDLRHQCGLVPQDPILFSSTVFDNIRYGKPHASQEEVIEAAKAAEVLEFASTLPNGIHTFVGERGVRLSGGQRQRIAI
ncbi:MAG: ABC transporter transmembrane domain-containing protein, partial [Burkholderiales bacterium]